MTMGPVSLGFLAAHSFMLVMVALSGRRDLASAGGFLMLVWFASWPSYLSKTSFDSAEYLMALDGVGFCLTVVFFARNQRAIWPKVWFVTYFVQVLASAFFDQIGRYNWLGLLNVLCAVQLANITFAALPDAFRRPKKRKRVKTRSNWPERREDAFPLPTYQPPRYPDPDGPEFGYNGPPASY